MRDEVPGAYRFVPSKSSLTCSRLIQQVSSERDDSGRFLIQLEGDTARFMESLALVNRPHIYARPDPFRREGRDLLRAFDLQHPNDLSPPSGLQHLGFVQRADGEALHGALQVFADFK